MGVSNTKIKCLKSNELCKTVYSYIIYFECLEKLLMRNSLLNNNVFVDIVEFSKVSTFTSEEINDLYLFFNHLSKAQRDDGVIDYDEFCQAVGLTDGIYA